MEGSGEAASVLIHLAVKSGESSRMGEDWRFGCRNIL